MENWAKSSKMPGNGICSTRRIRSERPTGVLRYWGTPVLRPRPEVDVSPVGRDAALVARAAATPAQSVHCDDASPDGFLNPRRGKPEGDIRAGGRTRTMRRERVGGRWPALPSESSLFFSGSISRDNCDGRSRLKGIVGSRVNESRSEILRYPPTFRKSAFIHADVKLLTLWHWSPGRDGEAVARWLTGGRGHGIRAA